MLVLVQRTDGDPTSIERILAADFTKHVPSIILKQSATHVMLDEFFGVALMLFVHVLLKLYDDDDND